MTLTIQELLEEYMGLETRSYSGRGMFGKSCLGVVVDDAPSFLIKLGHAIGEAQFEHSSTTVQIPKAAMDAMGTQAAVVYFPKEEYKERSHG